LQDQGVLKVVTGRVVCNGTQTKKESTVGRKGVGRSGRLEGVSRVEWKDFRRNRRWNKEREYPMVNTSQYRYTERKSKSLSTRGKRKITKVRRRAYVD